MTTAHLTTAHHALVHTQLTTVLNAAVIGLKPHTVRAYSRALSDFLNWLPSQPNPDYTRYIVEQYLAHRQLSAAAHNQALSAFKRLAEQSAAHGWLDHNTAQQIAGIPSRKTRGVRSGVWLNQAQAKSLLAAPDLLTTIGQRDHVILAMLVGCGLRRAELSALDWQDILTIDNRMHIVNLLGKHDRTRTIQIPTWCEPILNGWHAVTGPGLIARSFKRNGSLNGSLSPSAIRDIVEHYTKLIGIPAAPHDMRRTYAKLSRKGGAPLEVIQRSLGHASLTTTERYVNAGDEANAGDYLRL